MGELLENLRKGAGGENNASDDSQLQTVSEFSPQPVS